MPDQTKARPMCHKCQLPIREGEFSVIHEGRTYHRGCAPSPSSAGDKDDPYQGNNPIAI